MSITEVFGGEIASFHSINSQKLLDFPLFIYSEFRTGKTQLSHTLCGKQINCKISTILLIKYHILTSFCFIYTHCFSDGTASRSEWLFWWESHIHRHRGSFLFFQLPMLPTHLACCAQAFMLIHS